jgi:hypothetical protein
MDLSQLSGVSEKGWLTSDWGSQSANELLRFSRCELLLWEAGN